MTKKAGSLFAGAIAFVLFASVRNSISLHNMSFYLAACTLFFLVAIGTYYILDKKKLQENGKGSTVIGIIVVGALLLWMILYYINEVKTEQGLEEGSLIRHVFPLPLWIGLMAFGTIVCLFLLRWGNSEKHRKVRKWVRRITALLFAIGTAVQFYAPNIFRDVQGGTYHSHAYTNSIINVCWMIPYSKNLESLYGHYAILYMPVLRVLHKFLQIDYLTGIFLVTAIIAGLSVLLFTYVLDYFAKNDVIFYLAMLGIGEYYFMIMQGGVYMQVHPHRMIFPIALTALALKEKKSEKKYTVFAIILLSLSFVWSTEVGAVIMISYALYRWVLKIGDGKAFSVRKCLLLFPELLLFFMIPLVLAYTIINGYNLAAGGEILNMREFLYPLISDRDYISMIELPLPNITHAWIGATILFMTGILLMVYQILFPGLSGKEQENKAFFFLLGIINLGLMLYYINRPAEACIFITMYLMLIMQAMILEKCQGEYRARKEGGILFAALRVITTALLFIMAFDSVYSMPGAWKTSAKTIWKTDDLEEFAQNVWVQVPPNAMAFGEGVPELMSMVDRDTHLHTTEWSWLNMPLDTMEYARNELENSEWFFCNLFSLYYLQTNYPGLTDDFYLHEEFEYNGVKFGFYRREE